MKHLSYFLLAALISFNSQTSLADDILTPGFQQYAGVSFERVSINFNPGLEAMTTDYDVVEPYFGVIYPNNIGLELGLFTSLKEEKSHYVSSTGQVTLRNVIQGFRVSTLYQKNFKRLQVFGKLGVRYFGFESKLENPSGTFGGIPANLYVTTVRDSWEPHVTLGANVKVTSAFSLGASYETMPVGNFRFATDASILSLQMEFKL